MFYYFMCNKNMFKTNAIQYTKMVFLYFPSQASLNTSTKTRTCSPTVFITNKTTMVAI